MSLFAQGRPNNVFFSLLSLKSELQVGSSGDRSSEGGREGEDGSPENACGLFKVMRLFCEKPSTDPTGKKLARTEMSA